MEHRFRTATNISLDTAPNNWELACKYCGLEFSTFEDVVDNFLPKLYSGNIHHEIYCKSCREIFVRISLCGLINVLYINHEIDISQWSNLINVNISIIKSKIVNCNSK